MPRCTPEQVFQTFQKHLLSAFKTISSKEASRHFYFSETDRGGETEGFKHCAIDWDLGRIETQSHQVKPGSKSSAAIEELLSANAPGRMSMTCQMAIQLAYYGAILETLKELNPEDLSLFDRTFPANQFILRDFTTHAGVSFIPAPNNIACTEQYVDIKFHCLFPFIKWVNLTAQTNVKLEVGDIVIFDNVPDYLQLEGLAKRMGVKNVLPSRRVMAICSGTEMKQRYTAFGFKGEQRDTNQIADGLVAQYNYLCEQLGVNRDKKTRSDVLNKDGFFYVDYYQRVDIKLLTELVNNSERALASLNQFKKTLLSQVNKIRALVKTHGYADTEQKAISMKNLADILYKNKDYSRAVDSFIGYLLQKMHQLHSGMILQTQGNEVFTSVVSTHYNLGRCYENLENYPTALAHFEMAVYLAQNFGVKKNAKHTAKYSEMSEKVYGGNPQASNPVPSPS